MMKFHDFETAEERASRRELLDRHSSWFGFLRPDEKEDVLAGRCTLRVYDCVPILDYSGVLASRSAAKT